MHHKSWAFPYWALSPRWQPKEGAPFQHEQITSSICSGHLETILVATLQKIKGLSPDFAFECATKQMYILWAFPCPQPGL